MPLKSGSSQSAIGSNIRELHSGSAYAHTAEKFGAKKAQAQSVAIALHEAGKSRPRKLRFPSPTRKTT